MNRFEAFEDIQGKWRWRMIAPNHKVIATSGESFYSHANALRAAEGVRVGSAHSYVSTTPGLGTRAALRLKALLASGTKSARPRLRRASGRGRPVIPVRTTGTRLAAHR